MIWRLGCRAEPRGGGRDKRGIQEPSEDPNQTPRYRLFAGSCLGQVLEFKLPLWVWDPAVEILLYMYMYRTHTLVYLVTYGDTIFAYLVIQSSCAGITGDI